MWSIHQQNWTPEATNIKNTFHLVVFISKSKLRFGRMNCKIFSVFVIVALAFLTIAEGKSLFFIVISNHSLALQ